MLQINVTLNMNQGIEYCLCDKRGTRLQENDM